MPLLFHPLHNTAPLHPRRPQFNLLAPQEVARLQAAGLPLVDVRTEGLFDAGHIPRAVNVPLFQPIDGWSPMQIARRVGYAAFGVFNGTEINPRFEQARPATASCCAWLLAQQSHCAVHVEGGRGDMFLLPPLIQRLRQ